MDNPIVLHFVTLTVFSLMFAKGINYSLDQLTSVWRRPYRLLRSLLAVIVLVPVVVFLLLQSLDLPAGVATGLAILAAAPGAPMMTKRTQGTGGDPVYAASLQLTLALLAVIIAPLTLAVFYALFDLVTERVTLFEVAQQIAWVTFFPVIIGLSIRHFLPDIAERIKKPVAAFANVLFILFVLMIVALLALSPDMRAMLNIGSWPIAAVVIMIVVALTMGHLMGGPGQEYRSVLATACIARNAGLALFIAGLSDYEYQFVPTLITYVLLGSVLAIPYSVWSKRRLKTTLVETK